MSDAVEDYQIGEIAIRELTGWHDDVPIDPAWAEHVGRIVRPSLERTASRLAEMWAALPDDTKRVLAELAKDAPRTAQESNREPRCTERPTR